MENLVPSRILDRESLAFVFIFLLTAAFVYLFPVYVSIVYLVFLLIAFYVSEKDYLWLALAFVFESNPGGLFLRSDLSHNLTLLPGGGEGSIFFWMIFLLVALIKAYKLSPGYDFFFKNSLFLLAFYLVFLIITFGVGKYTIFFRSILPLTLLLILPRLIPDINGYRKFFKLVFISGFLVLVGQLYELIYMEPFAKMLGGNVLIMKNDAVVSKYISSVRPTYGIQLSFVSLLAALFFLSVKNNIWSGRTLYFIVFYSFFSLFISATRGWMIAASFVLICFLVISAPRTVQFYSKFAVVILVLFLSAGTISPVRDAVKGAWMRYTTLGALAEGDITAKGTSSRFDKRGPRVLKKFEESPVIGWGYGIESQKNSDEHVGNHNLLMHTGILGFALFILFLLNYFWKLIQNYLYLGKDNPYKSVQLMFIVFFTAFVIIHTSRQVFDYFMSFDTAMILLSMLCFSALIYKDSIEIETNGRAGITDEFPNHSDL
jgi:O-antigen ligase